MGSSTSKIPYLENRDSYEETGIFLNASPKISYGLAKFSVFHLRPTAQRPQATRRLPRSQERKHGIKMRSLNVKPTSLPNPSIFPFSLMCVDFASWCASTSTFAHQPLHIHE
eukprot:351815-Amorphochlora_amoeboformis.AAC.2